MSGLRGSRRALASLCLAGGIFSGEITLAESALVLPPPKTPEAFRGIIYDESGQPIGITEVTHSPLADGGLELSYTARVGKRVINSLEAELERIPGSNRVRPVWQRTRRPGKNLRGFIALRIDHRAGRATCAYPGEPEVEYELPIQERIGNVVMTLAVSPVAAGEVDEFGIQMFLCEGWRRVIDLTVRRADSRVAGAVELRLGFGLGPVLSFLLQPFLPDIRVWMDAANPNEWLGHHIPLYPGGPDVTLIREGVQASPFLRMK